MFKKKQMYLTETICDKVADNTVAFQISTVRPEIMPTNGNYALGDRLEIPMGKSPKGLVPLAHPYMGDYPCRVGHVDIMCESLCFGDNPFAKQDLTEKLSKVLMTPSTIKTSKLVAVTIIDGRLVFKIWEPAGYLDIKVLPDREVLGNSRFDFGLQMSRRAKSGVRIAYDLDGEYIRYIVEFYRNYKVYETRDIYYRILRKNEGKLPHFNGFMSTLTVQ